MFEDILGHTVRSLHPRSKVAVMLSGGVDSTLIYWALRALSTAMRFELTTYTVEDRSGYDAHVQEIRDFLGLSMKWDTWVQNVPNGDGWDGNIDGGIKTVLMSMKHDYVFTGVTANPPVELPNAPVRMTRDQIRNIPTLVCPFIERTKDYVYSRYIKYELQRLYSLTHSCTNQPVGGCGHCFQCLEKHWAEEQVTMTNRS